MAHHESEATLSPAELDFQDLMQRGDDFFKIEIFRPAKAWYTRALEMNIESEKVRERIAECDRLLKYERKVFTILGVIATVVLIIYMTFLK